MSDAEFTLLLINNLDSFFVFFAINICLLYCLLRKAIHHIFDPTFMMFFTAACANTVPCFLLYQNMITYEKFIYFVFTELLFWAGFLVIRGKYTLRFDFTQRRYDSEDLFTLFIILFIYVVSITSYSYSVAGIPIFQETKFGIRQNPVTAILLRTLALPNAFLILYIYHTLFNKIVPLFRKTIVSLCFLVLLTLSFLSGSKGFILTYVYFYFGYMFFYRKSKFIIFDNLKVFYRKEQFRVSFKLLAIIVISPLPVIAIYYGSSGLNGIGLLIYRFVASGDGYWQGFVNDVIDHINNTALWYERLFSFILGPLGLISDNAKIPIGTLILNQINPATVGLLEGANSRVPLFTWTCFGWGGMLVAFFLGMVSRLVAYGNIISAPHDLVGLAVLFSLYRVATTMAVDPTLFGAGIIDALFGVLIFNTFSLFICKKRGLILFR